MKLRTAAVALAVLAVSGCGSNSQAQPTEKQSTMNMQEAAEQADDIILGTWNAVRPPVEWSHRESTEGACTDATNDLTGTGSVTRRAAVLTIVSGERRGNLLGVVERHWKNSGYEITSVRDHKENPAIFASTPEDFRLSLVVGYQGQVFLDVVTPCVEESEVAPPATEANGGDGKGGDVPLPDRESAFWSATSTG
ncbi:hypothetical protein WDH52_01845 [Streptomyces sp. TRM70308]|uniref:hypothetical protein n=1 Tax=Streptomyces sp. TRM70308 TaxID=3131932 RepID=UPI003CFF5E34